MYNYIIFKSSSMVVWIRMVSLGISVYERMSCSIFKNHYFNGIIFKAIRVF